MLCIILRQLIHIVKMTTSGHLGFIIDYIYAVAQSCTSGNQAEVVLGPQEIIKKVHRKVISRFRK